MEGEAGSANPYPSLAHAEAPRVLGLLDRDPWSPTYGCLDRTYWAWKFTDFPGARFQEGLCFLAFLYTDERRASPYHRNPRLLSWIAGGFDFWARIQRSSGDFDEAYPYERSLAATAFTAFYLAEAFELLDTDLPPATAGRFRRAMARAGEWLCHNDETHGLLSNHLAAAAAALVHAARITGEERFAARSRFFLDRILAHQSEEGWYEEYGGADPGYQTHGSFYLARIAELTRDEALYASLERSLDFLAHFVHPDGSLGGEYASRNTQTYYPAAFEILARRSPRASWIASVQRPAVASLAAAGLGSVDAYNYFPLLNNLTFACRAVQERTGPPKAPEAPPEEPGVLHFPSAGILKVRRPGYDLFVGTTKGGVVKLFDRRARRLLANDCGYVGRLRGGRLVSSQWHDAERPVAVGTDSVEIAGRFAELSRPVLDPWRFVAFRIFTLTLGRLPRMAVWVKALLVRVLITRRKELDLRLRRRIRWDDQGVEIEDRLEGGLGTRLERLAQEDLFTTIHMGSSRYFVPSELAAPPDADMVRAVDPAALAAGVTRRRRLSVPS